MSNLTKLSMVILTMAVITVFVISFALAQGQVIEVALPTIFAPTADATVFAQDAREGYEVIDEAILIERARTMVGIEGEIEVENIFYVKAGYWQRTRDRMDYRDKPNHPIFVYSIKGDIKGYILFGAPSSDPNAPTPDYTIEPTAATVVFDAVTGHLLAYSGNKFIEDISVEMVNQDHDFLVTQMAVIEASMEPYSTLPPFESTSEVLPLP